MLGRHRGRRSARRGGARGGAACIPSPALHAGSLRAQPSRAARPPRLQNRRRPSPATHGPQAHRGPAAGRSSSEPRRVSAGRGPELQIAASEPDRPVRADVAAPGASEEAECAARRGSPPRQLAGPPASLPSAPPLARCLGVEPPGQTPLRPSLTLRVHTRVILVVCMLQLQKCPRCVCLRLTPTAPCLGPDFLNGPSQPPPSWLPIFILRHPQFPPLLHWRGNSPNSDPIKSVSPLKAANCLSLFSVPNPPHRPNSQSCAKCDPVPQSTHSNFCLQEFAVPVPYVAYFPTSSSVSSSFAPTKQLITLLRLH